MQNQCQLFESMHFSLSWPSSRFIDLEFAESNLLNALFFYERVRT